MTAHVLDWHRHPDRSWVWGICEGDGCELCDLAAAWLRANPAPSAAPALDPSTLSAVRAFRATRTAPTPEPAPERAPAPVRQLFLGERRIA